MHVQQRYIINVVPKELPEVLTGTRATVSGMVAGPYELPRNK